MSYSVIVAGSRGITREQTVRDAMNYMVRHWGLPRTVIAGAASGVDSVAVKLVRAYNDSLEYEEVEILEMPAQWSVHGQRAGYIRNEEMADEGDRLLAVWDGKSRGTQHMINIARRRGMPIIVWNGHTGQWEHE